MTGYYRSILKQAWSLTWTNKWLWVFGLFAAFLGSGGEVNLLIKNVSLVQESGAFVTDVKMFLTTEGISAWFSTLSEIVHNLNAISAALLVVVFLLMIALLVVSFMAQSGLVSSTFRLAKEESANMHEGWKRGKKKFVPVFLANLVGKIVIYAFVVIFSIPFFILFIKTDSLVWEWVLLLILFLAFIPLALIISFLVRYAIIYIVVKNSDVRSAINESVALFKKNWIVSIETALILFLVRLAYIVVFALVILFFALPFVLLGFVAVYFEIQALYMTAWALAIIVLGFVAAVLGAAFSTYYSAVWVVLFTRITEGLVLPKIIRLIAQLTARKKK